MKKILITAGTSLTAIKVKNLLDASFTTYLGSAEEVSSFMQTNFIFLPKSTSTSFAHEMLKICLTNNISYILPLEENEIEKLSSTIPLFDEYEIKILAPKHPLTQKTTTKWDNEKKLLLLDNGKNLLKNEINNLSVTGLGFLSNEENEFILLTV